MGVGGNFWDLLKPYARHEGVDFLRNKRVAVDLSFWIVQHDTAIRRRIPGARKPYLRTTFFRSIALFSKMGAFPVFVIDGEPSPLKARARMERFFRGSGVELPATVGDSVAEGGETPVKERNQLFAKYVRECVELLELLGMPILKARCEAEALCAQLNYEGHVDACITADSDAFLFGAKCVIKCLQSKSKAPFECYYVSDVEAGLGLGRKQMVAIALLVGNDHDLHGVSGFGVDTAVRFVKLFTEDEILDRLSEAGKGVIALREGNFKSAFDLQIHSSDDDLRPAKSSHCSHCGHPGSKRAHVKLACENCTSSGSENCIEKPAGFRCKCPTCVMNDKVKEQKKHESWQIKLFTRIAAEHNFPNKEIIDMYLSDNHGNHSGNNGPSIRWDKPSVECVVDFLSYHQHWEPSYIRQRMLPMLSTNFLREAALSQKEGSLLYDQYEFHSIQRVKISNGHPYYLVKWKIAAHNVDSAICNIPNGLSETRQNESMEVNESNELLDEPDIPQILIDDGCSYLLTDENMELVQAAFPEEVDRFLEEKRVKESKSKLRRDSKNEVGAADKSESVKSSTIQLNLMEFYRSTKVTTKANQGEDLGNNSCKKEGTTRRRKMSTDSDRKLTKSVRRRLLFD